MDIKSRENKVRKVAATFGLAVTKSRSKSGFAGPYSLEPVPTREAQQRWRGKYAFRRFWLDELEAELDHLAAESTP